MGSVAFGDLTTANRTHGSRTTISLGGLLHSGRALDVRETVPLPEFASFTFPQPVAAALGIALTGGGIEIKGTIDGAAQGECARCLEPVNLPLHLEIDERFDPGSGREYPLGESNVLYGDELDVADLVRQLIDSGLPIVLLCNPHCPGLCTECGRKKHPCCPHPE